MNTKHILLTSALVVSALAFTSCEDFFDTSSKKDLNTETAYSNLESAEMALVGCYDGWQRTISDEGVGMYLLAEFASEQAFAGLGLSDAKNNNVIDQFNLGIAPSYNDIFNVDWQNYYKAIFRCNQLIVQEENIDWAGDIKAQGRVMGEAHAIRGILYFDLVRMFGDVPLLAAPSEENIPRSPASDVYQLIFEDFKYAIEHIPADAYPLDNNDTNDGRITKYAAEALMARAYLYHTGYYGAEHPHAPRLRQWLLLTMWCRMENMNWRKTMPTSGCLLVLLMLRVATLMPGIRHTPASGMTAPLGKPDKANSQGK